MKKVFAFVALFIAGAASAEASETRHLRCENKEDKTVIRLELSRSHLKHADQTYQLSSVDYNDIVAFNPKSGSIIRMDRVSGLTTINGGKPFVCDIAVRKF